MYREPKLPHVLCGLSFCEACHFVRPIPVEKVHNLIVGVKEGEVDFEITIWTKSSDDSRCLNKCNIFRTSINWSLSS